MWTQLTLVIRTCTILLVLTVAVESNRPPKTPKHNVISVRRIKIRERSKSDVNFTHTPSEVVRSYPNSTNSGGLLEKLSPERRARCRRYARQYYNQEKYPLYQPSIEFSQQLPDYSQYSGYYVPPQYAAYVPSKCYNYCLQCPTSTCRRRCPMLPNPPVPSQACNCDPNGSKYSSCDPTSGNCICKPHYEGRTCDVCKPGYWKTLKKDCIKCHCNEFGSIDSVCDQETGQCSCRPGVTGQNCDQCLPNFYGTVDTECIECEPCTKKGHVCGKGGKCMCPTLTIGKECERCSLNAWGYEPGIGCKSCNCSHTGSSSSQCDKISGLCPCKTGYEGNKCDRCTFGYYGYPNCRKCLCNPIGTLDTECQNGDCQCNENGSCNCKENVQGSRCNTCRDGTFGLSRENPKGCKDCFCFGRSNQCVDTKYNWDKIRFEKADNGIQSNEPISSDTISLPNSFMGDLTTSYDGYLSVNGSGGKFSVFLTGNGISLKSEFSTNELRLNERYWKVTSGNILPSCQTVLTRECLLLVLQHVTSIIVQGQDMEISEVLLDSAKPYIPYNRTSHSIEKCDCPPEYTGLSCQDPNEGFYRYFPHEFEVSQTPSIDRVIGVARPCDCNGRSSECDPDTGYCKNCSNNTAGYHCELCDTGFYQDYLGNCQPCLCPSESDNNAESCVAKKYGFVCHCKKGYTGSKCEHCKDSYYRDAITNKCIPCNCNFYGSYSSICNYRGMCECKPGFQGDKCNQCRNPREYIKDGICTPCDECTQLLFHDIERLSKALESIKDLLKDGLSPPWKVLDATRIRYKLLNKTFAYKYDRANHIVETGDLDELEDRVYNMGNRMELLGEAITEYIQNSGDHLNKSSEFLEELKNVNQILSDIIKNLRDFGKKHVDVESSVVKAGKILNEIKFENQKHINDIEAANKPVFTYCHSVNEKVNNLYHELPELPYGALDELNDKLDELDLITREIEEKTAITELTNEENKATIERLKKSIENLEGLKENIENNIEEITTSIKDINTKLGEFKDVVDTVENFDFSELEEWEEKLYQFEEDSPDLEELVRRASEHVGKLKNIVNNRVGLLNFTKDETEKIKTSGAYNEIMEGIEEARIKADEAKDILQKALDTINPIDSDRLIDKANLAHTKSDRLKHRITNMKNLSNSFNALKKEVESFKDRLIDSGKFNNDLNRQLLNLEDQLTSKGDLVNKLHQAIDNSTEIIDKMRQIEKDFSELNITIRYDLFNEKTAYLNARSEAEKEIKKAGDSVSEAIKKVTQLLENNKQIDDGEIRDGQLKLDTVTSKIGELQNKILYARQAAESINVAMGLSNCSMLYSVLQVEVFRSLAITFKCANCQLFNWDRGGVSIRIKNGRAIMNFTVDDQSDEISTDKEGGIKQERTLFVESLQL